MKTTTNHIALSVKDLSIGYKNTVVASNINFDISQGKLMGIVGINGIGKSTLLRTLAKVQPQLSGNISINEKPLENYSSIELASTLSIVLTEPLASKNMTVLELITLGRQPYTNWIGALSKTDKSKITEAIQMLELEELKHEKCYQLSDGQLQRVMIARALAQDTAIILLDEPTTHLDLYHKVQILKLLKSIASQTNKTVVFTSHEIEIVLQLCDTMLLIDGHKNAFGTPNKLIEQKDFEQLFPSDIISFDARSRSFRIKK